MAVLATLGVIAAAAKAGQKFRKNRRDAEIQDRDFRRERRLQTRGRKMMTDPAGISAGQVEGMRSGAMQTALAGTRGLESEARRGAAGARGGSELATLAILAQQRGQALAGVEGDISAANLATQKYNVARGAQIADEAKPVRPTITKSDAAMQFGTDLLGSAAKFGETKRKAALEKAKLAAGGLTQMDAEGE